LKYKIKFQKKKKKKKKNNKFYFFFIIIIEHNHSFIRDEGAIPIIASDLSNTDNDIVITTAMTVAKLAKQGINKLLLLKKITNKQL